MITIYQFAFVDTNGGQIKSRRWGTRAAVEDMRATVLEDTAIEVDENSISWDPNIEGVTAQHFDPWTKERPL